MGRLSEEDNSASDRNPSGKEDGMARSEEFPRTGNFSAETSTVPGKLGQVGHLFHFTQLDSNCWHAKK